MKVAVRLILLLFFVIGVVSLVFTFSQVDQEKSRQEGEIQMRAVVLAESFQEIIEPLLNQKPFPDFQRLLEKFSNRKRLAGLGILDEKGKPVASSQAVSSFLIQIGDYVTKEKEELSRIQIFSSDDGTQHEMHWLSYPLHNQNGTLFFLVILHRADFIQNRLMAIWWHVFWRTLIQTILISLVIVFFIQWTIVNPISKLSKWMKDLHSNGSINADSTLPVEDIFSPIAREATTFARHLSAIKAASDEEAKLRQSGEVIWTPERLKEYVKGKLQGSPLFVVSNREPYMHLTNGKEIDVIVPAGGLVTALDPILKVCGGTWVAHGSGDADQTVVDEKNRIKVPPEEPAYFLKRVFLSKEEESGYYYGFSNEGFWPLCHITHTRPIFREEDWSYYKKVNEKFSQAVLEELETAHGSCVLIQDYHLALLPRLIKTQRDNIRVSLFWHIPWPNPEAFSICPWQKEILHGMLGADLIGFHTQFHCNNFLETVDRLLECRIDWSEFSIHREGHTTRVKPFPIGVSFPYTFQEVHSHSDEESEFIRVVKEMRSATKILGIGVERMDYTKGVLERLQAIERFLEKYPKYQRDFIFCQLGVPSRTHIKRYNDFLAEVDAEIDRINWKFKSGDWKPIIYFKKHHSHRAIFALYQLADFCMVTSLHDGMNLVAKEFVASRADEDGVLILSSFAGAALELKDALIVNPYDTEQVAESIRFSLEMPREERAKRMRWLRHSIRENNIYRWAANLITDTVEVRLRQDIPKSG
ncbi:MAG: trehalose-6-phosphate synthase [Candidatus Ozemobacteraceae bacterium]